MKRILYYICLALFLVGGGTCIWFLFNPAEKTGSPSTSEQAVSGRDKGRPAKGAAAVRAQDAEEGNKETAESPSVPEGLTLAPEVRERLARQEAESNTPEAKEKDRVLRAVQDWEKLVDDVVREDNAEPLPVRGKKLKDALAKMPASEKDTSVHTLLNLLPDESFAMMEAILLDPKEDPDVLDVVFSDMLNRPDEVKNGYILQIANMKDHPAFTDAIHIKTVTELGNEK